MTRVGKIHTYTYAHTHTHIWNTHWYKLLGRDPTLSIFFFQMTTPTCPKPVVG